MPSVANAGNAPNRQRKSEAKTIRIEFARERRAFVIRISGVEFAAFQACASRAQPKGGSQLKSVLPSPPAHSENFFTYFLPSTASSSRAKTPVRLGPRDL